MLSRRISRMSLLLTTMRCWYAHSDNPEAIMCRPNAEDLLSCIDERTGKLCCCALLMIGGNKHAISARIHAQRTGVVGSMHILHGLFKSSCLQYRCTLFVHVLVCTLVPASSLLLPFFSTSIHVCVCLYMYTYVCIYFSLCSSAVLKMKNTLHCFVLPIDTFYPATCAQNLQVCEEDRIFMHFTYQIPCLFQHAKVSCCA